MVPVPRRWCQPPSAAAAVACCLLSVALLCVITPAHSWDSLGFGVQPYDGQFTKNHIKSRVLDLGTLRAVTVSGRPGTARTLVDATSVATRREEAATGESFEEFSRAVATDVQFSGSWNAFKASVSARFAYDSVRSVETHYARRALRVETGHLRVRLETPAALQAAVLPEVAAAFASLDPLVIFRRYGTHVSTRVSVGGLLEVWSSSSKSKFSSSSEFSSAVDASWSKTVSGKASINSSQALTIRRLSTKEGLLVRGGDVSLASQDSGVEAWVTSVLGAAEEVGFLLDGAVPIWELIRDAGRSRAVRAAYEKMFGARTMVLKRFASRPHASQPRVPWPEAEVYVPNDDWKVVSGGADVRFFGPGQLLTQSYPILEGNRPVGWKASSKDHLSPDPGQVRAYVVALYDPLNEWEVVVRLARSGQVAHPAASATVPSGFLLVGGGANDLWRDRRGYGNMLVDSFPSGTRTWTASGKDHIRGDHSTVIAYAIGLRKRSAAGWPRRRVRSTRFGPVAHPAGTIYASPQWGFVGGGASVSKGGWGNMLTGLVPATDGRSFSAGAKDHLESDPQTVRVYGIELQGATYVQHQRDVLGLSPAASGKWAPSRKFSDSRSRVRDQIVKGRTDNVRARSGIVRPRGTSPIRRRGGNPIRRRSYPGFRGPKIRRSRGS